MDMKVWEIDFQVKFKLSFRWLSLTCNITEVLKQGERKGMEIRTNSGVFRKRGSNGTKGTEERGRNRKMSVIDRCILE